MKTAEELEAQKAKYWANNTKTIEQIQAEVRKMMAVEMAESAQYEHDEYE